MWWILLIFLIILIFPRFILNSIGHISEYTYKGFEKIFNMFDKWNDI